MANIKIGSIAEVDGGITDRLIVCEDGKEIYSVIISCPMTIDCVIEKLELIAWRLKKHKNECHKPL